MSGKRHIVIRNKRGIASEQLLLAILALTLLVLAGLGFSKLMTGHWIPNFIPSFNQTQGRGGDLAQIRYVIPDDRVDFYDGATWHAFGVSKRELGGREYDGAGVMKAMREHYFDTQGTGRQPESVVLFGDFAAYTVRIVGVSDKNYREPRSWWENSALQDALTRFVFQDTRAIERGDTMLELWKNVRGQRELQHLYVLSVRDGQVYPLSRRSDVSDVIGENPSVFALVQRRALVWRERVLEHPVQLEYRTARGAGGAEATNEAWFCLTRTSGTQDLVVDLQQQADVGAVCGGRR